jgi:hypothetical protein
VGGVVEERIGLCTKVSVTTACYDLPSQLAGTSLIWIDFFVMCLYRDTVRYNYAHSILPYSSDRSVDVEGERLRPGHRISLMIRVSLASVCYLFVFGSRGMTV